MTGAGADEDDDDGVKPCRLDMDAASTAGKSDKLMSAKKKSDGQGIEQETPNIEHLNRQRDVETDFPLNVCA